MTSPERDAPRLPSTDDLIWAPERAILAALDANLLLAIRALRAEHPLLDNPDDDDEPDHPVLLLAESVVASARSLRRLLAGYDHVGHRIIDHAVNLHDDTPACSPNSSGPAPTDSIPT